MRNLSVIKKSYYSIKMGKHIDRCYYLTGEKAGNKWIDFTVPNPVWMSLIWTCIPNEDELKDCTYSTTAPKKKQSAMSKTPTFESFVNESSKKPKNLQDALKIATDRFNNDPEVVKAVATLKKKMNRIVDDTFTQVDPFWQDSDNFVEMNDEYYGVVRENKPDDYTLFDYLWFTQ